ncbi:MAG: selenide, water dikinase SelD [Bacteroidetes bacterium]|jgi:selenide,water dikinase|nr:selenide, water dikinase SelD [Bacteroidota bacterium]
MNEEVALTAYSKGSGCGCKIEPAVLKAMIGPSVNRGNVPGLLIGNEFSDDAAVFAFDDTHALIATVDFFTPIVDDAFDFGRIAATNALSDVYAMGGTPFMALAVLGWPVDKLPHELAARVMAGAEEVCKQAGVALAGGHSIDSAEPFFGLSVNGKVNRANIKANHTVQEGDAIYITKALGTGIISAAAKKKILQPGDLELAVQSMTTLNTAGTFFGTLPYVTAMTDITGFGLLGHLGEMIDPGKFSATIEYKTVPFITNLKPYTDVFCMPDGTTKNWKSYHQGIVGVDGVQLITLCDPQTSGGLVVTVTSTQVAEFEKACKQEQIRVTAVGRIEKSADYRIRIS